MLFLVTVNLIIQENEVAYNVYIESETGKYYFKPTVYQNRNLYPPHFWAYQVGASWEFDGTTNHDIQMQAIEEISYYLDFKTNSPVEKEA
jgi:hypothetical protein